MSKQRPDPAKIANELSGASAFFRPVPQPVEPAPVAGSAPNLPLAAPTSRPAASAPPLPHAVVTSRRQTVTTSDAAAPIAFDINRETASHDTLRLALDETRALEALKSALKWDHDVTVSKNDICRVALHELIEDYRARGSSSDAVKRLRHKLGRQYVTTARRHDVKPS